VKNLTQALRSQPTCRVLCMSRIATNRKITGTTSRHLVSWHLQSFHDVSQTIDPGAHRRSRFLQPVHQRTTQAMRTAIVPGVQKWPDRNRGLCWFAVAIHLPSRKALGGPHHNKMKMLAICQRFEPVAPTTTNGRSACEIKRYVASQICCQRGQPFM